MTRQMTGEYINN